MIEGTGVDLASERGARNHFCSLPTLLTSVAIDHSPSKGRAKVEDLDSVRLGASPGVCLTFCPASEACNESGANKEPAMPKPTPALPAAFRKFRRCILFPPPRTCTEADE